MQDAVESGDFSSPHFLFLVCHSLSFQTILPYQSLLSNCHSSNTHFSNHSSFPPFDDDITNNRQRARSSMSASAVRILSITLFSARQFVRIRFFHAQFDKEWRKRARSEVTPTFYFLF